MEHGVVFHHILAVFAYFLHSLRKRTCGEETGLMIVDLPWACSLTVHGPGGGSILTDTAADRPNGGGPMKRALDLTRAYRDACSTSPQLDACAPGAVCAPPPPHKVYTDGPAGRQRFGTTAARRPYLRVRQTDVIFHPSSSSISRSRAAPIWKWCGVKQKPFLIVECCYWIADQEKKLQIILLWTRLFARKQKRQTGADRQTDRQTDKQTNNDNTIIQYKRNYVCHRDV